MSASQLDLSKPHLMTSFTDKWPCHSWTFKTLATLLGDKQFSCRVAPKSCGQKMETQCSHQDVTIEQFCDWLDGRADESNPLSSFKREENSCYVDYKYMKDMFEDHPETFEEVQWKDFGLIGYDGYDSTIWLSSEGANTPGHQDTYGFNLITQICGRKLWILFPPEDSLYLYPTRVPYEESSIFTEVNIRRPDQSHPKFKLSHPVVVTLCPGQTLYVPRHWWHYVESLEPSISINVWVPMREDRQSRLSEAITRCLATSLISSLDTSEDGLLQSTWLNPTESLAPTTMNLLLLKTAVCQLLEDHFISEDSTRNDGKQDMKEELISVHGLIQAEDHQRRRDTNLENEIVDFELQSTTDMCFDGSNKNPESTPGGASADLVPTDSDLAGQSDKASDPPLLSLLAEKMKGYMVVWVDTPFQYDCEVKLPFKRTADLHQGSSPKKCRQEPASSSNSLTVCVDLNDETETSHSRVFSFSPCPFDAYLKFLDNLCLQIQCRQCHRGSVTNATQNDGQKMLSKSYMAAGISYVSSPAVGVSSPAVGVSSPAVGLPCQENLEPEDGSTACYSENVGSPFVQPGTGRKRKTSFDYNNEQTGRNDSNCSKIEETLSSGAHVEKCDSGSTSDGTFSQLSQVEVAETLLTCALNPVVVKMVARLFKEQCEYRLKQKHILK